MAGGRGRPARAFPRYTPPRTRRTAREAGADGLKENAPVVLTEAAELASHNTRNSASPGFDERAAAGSISQLVGPMSHASRTPLGNRALDRNVLETPLAFSTPASKKTFETLFGVPEEEVIDGRSILSGDRAEMHGSAIDFDGIEGLASCRGERYVRAGGEAGQRETQSRMDSNGDFTHPDVNLREEEEEEVVLNTEQHQASTVYDSGAVRVDVRERVKDGQRQGYASKGVAPPGGRQEEEEEDDDDDEVDQLDDEDTPQLSSALSITGGTRVGSPRPDNQRNASGPGFKAGVEANTDHSRIFGTPRRSLHTEVNQRGIWRSPRHHLGTVVSDVESGWTEVLRRNFSSEQLVSIKSLIQTIRQTRSEVVRDELHRVLRLTIEEAEKENESRKSTSVRGDNGVERVSDRRDHVNTNHSTRSDVFHDGVRESGREEGVHTHGSGADGNSADNSSRGAGLVLTGSRSAHDRGREENPVDFVRQSRIEMHHTAVNRSRQDGIQANNVRGREAVHAPLRAVVTPGDPFLTNGTGGNGPRRNPREQSLHAPDPNFEENGMGVDDLMSNYLRRREKSGQRRPIEGRGHSRPARDTYVVPRDNDVSGAMRTLVPPRKNNTAPLRGGVDHDVGRSQMGDRSSVAAVSSVRSESAISALSRPESPTAGHVLKKRRGYKVAFVDREPDSSDVETEEDESDPCMGEKRRGTGGPRRRRRSAAKKQANSSKKALAAQAGASEEVAGGAENEDDDDDRNTTEDMVKYYSGTDREIIDHARTYVKASILVHYGFPDPLACVDLARKCFDKACEDVLGKDWEVTRPRYTKAIRKLLVAEISTTRSKLKKAALLIIERYYRFRPKGNEVSKHLDAERRSHLKRQITRDNISNLLRDDMYQIDDDLEDAPCYSHPAIAALIIEYAFSKNSRTCLPLLLERAFQPLPLPLIAISAAALRNSLEEYSTGAHRDKDFTFKTYNDYYKTVLNDLKEMERSEDEGPQLRFIRTEIVNAGYMELRGRLPDTSRPGGSYGARRARRAAAGRGEDLE